MTYILSPEQKARKAAQAKARRLANPEKERERQRRKYARNPETGRNRQRRYKLRHAEKLRLLRQERKEQRRPYAQAYYLAHKAEYRAREEARRAQQANAPLNDLTADEWRQIQESQDHRCAYCGKRFHWRLTKDHILSISKGGSHTLHNVIGACGSCNSRKFTNPPPVSVQPLLL